MLLNCENRITKPPDFTTAHATSRIRK